jgi:hypothetical protein
MIKWVYASDGFEQEVVSSVDQGNKERAVGDEAELHQQTVGR